MNVTDPDVPYTSHLPYKISINIWTYVPPFVIVIGTVSNILAIVVLTRKRLRNSTTMFYLTVLSFSNILVLNAGLLVYWIHIGLNTDLTILSSTGCKIQKFSVYFTTDFCNWILVAVTLDRCILVCLPYKAKQLKTKKAAKIIILILALIMFLINFHLFWGIDIVQEVDGMYCDTTNTFTSYAWRWIDFCLYSFLPFIIMIVCNAFIVRHIFIANKKVVSYDRAVDSTSISTIVNTLQSNIVKGRHVSRITKMLQALNVAFCLLTMPVVVLHLYFMYMPKSLSDYSNTVLDMLDAIATMLEFTNNAIHFFLYCMTGSSFRKEFCTLFSRKLESDTQESMTVID